MTEPRPKMGPRDAAWVGGCCAALAGLLRTNAAGLSSAGRVLRDAGIDEATMVAADIMEHDKTLCCRALEALKPAEEDR